MHPAGESGPTRCFFLAATPAAGRARLIEEDERHALRVLRARVGDELTGLDGHGGRWPLRITAVSKRELELELAGEASFEPQPGAAGAALPWIELALSWPKGARADDMLDRLVQLGAAAIAPLQAQRTQGHAAEQVGQRTERWMRIARAACKQSRRAWLPEIGAARGVAELLGDAAAAAAAAASGASAAAAAAADSAAATAASAAATFALQPGASVTLGACVRDGLWGTREAPVRLLIGPEGGWAAADLGIMEAAGVRMAALGPHVLRVETAAEAALAVVVQRVWRR